MDDGSKLSELLEQLTNGISQTDKETILDSISVLFQDHSKACQEHIYKPDTHCSVLNFLKGMQEEQLLNLLPVISNLTSSHQEVAVSCIRNFAWVQRNLLKELIIFCTKDGAQSQVVFTAVQDVISSYQSRRVFDDDLIIFFVDLLTKFSLPPPISPEIEDDWMKRTQRENLLIVLSNQVGTAVGTMPPDAVHLNSKKLVAIFVKKSEELNFPMKTAILFVLAKGLLEKKFSQLMHDRLDDALRDYYMTLAPIVFESNDIPKLVSLLWPLIVVLIHNKNLVAMIKAKQSGTTKEGWLLLDLCNECNKFDETKIFERPKKPHKSLHYSESAEKHVREMTKLRVYSRRGTRQPFKKALRVYTRRGRR